MKSFFLACIMMLAVAVTPSFADSLTFTNHGNLSGNIRSGTVQSQLDSISLNGAALAGFPLGPLSINTGSFSGSFLTGGTFTGGSLSIALNNGAVLFTTTISGTWTKLSNDLYELVATFSGVVSGTSYSGSTTQFFGLVGGGDDHGDFPNANFHHRGSGNDDSSNCGNFVDLYGTTTITTATVPEPSTLTFLGTGLIAAAGAVRRKLQSGRA